MQRFSDGVDRPDSYDGTSLSRAIGAYFGHAQAMEAARLREENARLKERLAHQKTQAKAAGAGR